MRLLFYGFKYWLGQMDARIFDNVSFFVVVFAGPRGDAGSWRARATALKSASVTVLRHPYGKQAVWTSSARATRRNSCDTEMALDEATIDSIRAVAAAAKPARKELQRLAKLCGIKANQKNTVIIDELKKVLTAPPSPVAPPAPVAAEPSPVAPPPPPALPRRSIAAPPVASLPPLPPPVASAAVAPPPRQPVLPAAAVAATLGKIDAAVQEVNRAQQIKADRGAKSAKKAEDHNRARTVGAMRDMRPPVPQAHRVGAAQPRERRAVAIAA